jgi:hypothetical protein
MTTTSRLNILSLQVNSLTHSIKTVVSERVKALLALLGLKNGSMILVQIRTSKRIKAVARASY